MPLKNKLKPKPRENVVDSGIPTGSFKLTFIMVSDRLEATAQKNNEREGNLR